MYCSFYKRRTYSAIVLEDLRQVLSFAKDYEEEFALLIQKKNTEETRQEIKRCTKEHSVLLKRQDELTVIFKKLYEDNVLGKVTNEQFRVLSGSYNEEQESILQRLPTVETRLKELEPLAANVDEFLVKAKKYTDIQELSPQILRLFIDKVVVHERAVKYSRTAEQKIEIHYSHIGSVQ